jgi:hypothetical protein
LLSDQGRALEGFGGALALLHCAQLGFDAFGEREAALSCHTFHHLFHTAVGSDAESDGLLAHPVSILKVFADVSRDFSRLAAARWQSPAHLN